MAFALGSFTTLKLQFGHDCKNVGCTTPGCELCKNNPDRRCRTHFRDKYVDNANRVFTAWCTAPIQAKLVDAETEEPYLEEVGIPSRVNDLLLELCLLEGTAYEQKEKEVGAENVSDEDFESMIMLDNISGSKPEPLLVPGKDCPGEHTADHRLRLPLQAEGTHIYVRTSRSSQSAQGGRTRPFRLLARAVWEDGTAVPYIQPDVSEPFVVTTRRTQGAEKALIPRWDDSVSKLPGVGKETFSKLKDLRAAGIGSVLPNYKIQTVGQLYELINEAQPTLLQDLGRTLGLKLDKVAELQIAVRNVAREDHRKRVWANPELFPHKRLLYTCEGGAVDLIQPHIEVLRDCEDGSVDIINTADLPPDDQLQIIEMRQHAFGDWWMEGHPGWGIFTEMPEAGADGGLHSIPELPTEPLPPARPSSDRLAKQRRTVSREYEESMVSRSSSEAAAHEGMVPSRSVFDVDLYPEHIPAMDTNEAASATPTADAVPDTRDIANAPSAPLLDIPVGLAYMYSGPLFERNGPIRFKRSVSGNRYKPMGLVPGPLGGIAEMSGGPPPAGGGPPLTISSPVVTLPPDVADRELSVQAAEHYFPLDGLGTSPFQPPDRRPIPPRPSRELRSQTSLDRVSRWQQNRPLSNSNLGATLSEDFYLSCIMAQGLVDHNASDDELEL